MGIDLINTIFGMKVRQARTEAGLTLTEMAAQCDLSPSYMTEIEKGRKYPRSDKIMRMAEVLGKDYDQMVSIKLPPSLSYLESALSSSIMQRFPFHEFGLEAEDLVNLLTREPDRASALLHAILEIGRRYDLQEEDFLRAALRSYQEFHENYFPELEEAAQQFQAEFGARYELDGGRHYSPTTLRTLLEKEFNCEVDDKRIQTQPELNGYRSVFVPGKPGTLFVNGRLFPRQIRFLLARELGYQYLGLQERTTTSPPEQIDSFTQILNYFKASYFGGALLMPRADLTAEIDTFFNQSIWNPQPLLDMLDKYNVTPEMLLYRFSELVPQYFGIKLHFLRFHHVGHRFQLVKQLNMNRLLVPSGIGLYEHYCRRWLSVRLLTDLEEQDQHMDNPHTGVQLSEFLESQERFLCIGFSRPLVLSSGVTSSVIVGFRVDADLPHTIRFVNDPAIPHTIINETCERCPLTAEQCHERAAAPSLLQAHQTRQARRLALTQLAAGKPDPSEALVVV
ncbi:MAG: helix-turn-helix domain-containing protein [Chloroflexota bacterium]